MRLANMKTIFDPKTKIGFVIRYTYKFDNTSAYGPINKEFYDFATSFILAREGTLYWDTPHPYRGYYWVPVINKGGVVRTATVVDFVDDEEDTGVWIPDALERVWLRALNVDDEALSPNCRNTFPYIRNSSGMKEIKNNLRDNGYETEAYHFLNVPMSTNCISQIDAVFEKYSNEQDV